MARQGLSREAPPRGSDAAAAFIQYVEERARRRTEEGPLWRQLTSEHFLFIYFRGEFWPFCEKYFGTGIFYCKFSVF
jgi:hypothetical protein